MSRRYEDVYERDGRERRPRDSRDLQREQDSQDRMGPREQRRPDDRELDRMGYPRDGRSDLRMTRSPPSRSAYPYSNQMERDNVSSRAYVDDARERHRPPIDLQSQRREEASRIQEYFLPGEDINREVIQYDIARYLGNDATVRPFQHPDGRQGYLIRAYQALTSAMIAQLKQDSQRFEQEQGQRRQQYGQPGSYEQSATFDNRRRQAGPDVSRSGYAGYQMDSGMDTRMDARTDVSMHDYYDDDYRGAVRGYRDAEPRMDPRQQLPINRHGQMPTVPGVYQMDTQYPAHQVQPLRPHYDVPGYPRTTVSNTTFPNTLGPYAMSLSNMADVNQGLYSAGLPTTTSRPALVYGDPLSGRSTMGYQAGSGHPGWGDTPNFQEGGLPTTTSRPAPAYGDPATSEPTVGYRAGSGHPGWGDTPNFQGGPRA